MIPSHSDVPAGCLFWWAHVPAGCLFWWSHPIVMFLQGVYSGEPIIYWCSCRVFILVVPSHTDVPAGCLFWWSHPILMFLQGVYSGDPIPYWCSCRVFILVIPSHTDVRTGCLFWWAHVPAGCLFWWYHPTLMFLQAVYSGDPIPYWCSCRVFILVSPSHTDVCAGCLFWWFHTILMFLQGVYSGDPIPYWCSCRLFILVIPSHTDVPAGCLFWWAHPILTFIQGVYSGEPMFLQGVYSGDTIRHWCSCRLFILVIPSHTDVPAGCLFCAQRKHWILFTPFSAIQKCSQNQKEICYRIVPYEWAFTHLLQDVCRTECANPQPPRPIRECRECLTRDCPCQDGPQQYSFNSTTGQGFCWYPCDCQCGWVTSRCRLNTHYCHPCNCPCGLVFSEQKCELVCDTCPPTPAPEPTTTTPNSVSIRN